ncbi:MAG: hypothetical protein CMQ41_07765 [Gammaproteobacteria bacterium]|nr:hypothetical protein [Gammaproteobacteria bacterium]|tara:strand:- start:182 stop:391 length:210 start_codon:yes stop_codon:yes gene_type:complete
MQLSNQEKPCWFITIKKMYLAGPFYTQNQAQSHLNSCIDIDGNANIEIKGETFTIPRNQIKIIKDTYWE